METKDFIREAAGEILSWSGVNDVNVKKSWGQVEIKVNFGYRLAWTWRYSESAIANVSDAWSLLSDMHSHIAQAVSARMEQ